MKRFLFLIGCGILLQQNIHAQNEQDALRYSRTGFGGTARFASMSGAFGALGGDASCFSINPAGIGILRRNELVVTPSLFTQNVSAEYNGTTTYDSRSNLRFTNFAFVFAGKTENTEAKGWQAAGMGISYNRLSSFQSNLTMAGQSTTSMMDSWKKTAGGSGPYNLDPFNEGLAWNAWLLNTVIGDSTHYTDTVPDGTLLNQYKKIDTRGGMGEWAFTVGGNYSNRVYLGASLAIPQVRYTETSVYTEEVANDTTHGFNSLQFDQYLETKGRGFVFKAGVIFRPVDFLRVGLAFHSPAVLKLADAYYSKMTGNIGDTLFPAQSPTGAYNYTIRTPMRIVTSMAFVLGKSGLLSLDYELVDYSEAKLSAEDYTFFEANKAIKAKYKMTSNIRVGGEFRYLPFVFRGGFAWYGSPYNPSVVNDAARIYITGGAGYRDPDDQFFIDLGVVSSSEKSNYYFYDQSLVNPVNNSWKSFDVVLTFGFRY